MIRNFEKLLVVDLEAACWDDVRDPGEVIQIGIAQIDLTKDGKPISKFADYFVKPDKDDISTFCTELTGITQEEIDLLGQENKLDSICKKLRNRKAHKYVWGSWGAWDYLHLREECAGKVGIKFPFSYSHVNIKIQHSIIECLTSQRGQARAIRHHNLSFPGRNHDAFADACAAALIWRKLLWDIKPDNETIRKFAYGDLKDI